MPRASLRLLMLVVVLFATTLVGCGSPESRKAKYVAKGKAYVEQANWEKARIEFRNALQVMPNDAEVRFENGYVAEKLGSARDAVAFYTTALEHNPDYTEARARLGRLLLLGGASDRALDTVEVGLQKHPGDPQLLTIRAAVRSQRRDTAGAVEDAERAYALAPSSEDTIAVLAGVYRGAGRQEDSVKTLEAGIARLPASVELRLALVQDYIAANHPAQVEAVLKDIVRLQPDQPMNAVRLATYYNSSGKPEEAEATLRQAIARDPKAMLPKRALVEFIAHARGQAAAEKELLTQIEQNPKQTELRFALAEFYVNTGQPSKAENVLEALAKAEGSSGAALQAKDSLAQLKFQSGDVVAADKLVAEVLHVSARDTPALALRARIALVHGDPKGAIADLRSVLRDQPNSAPTLRALAQAHIANGEPPQADEALRRGIDAQPGDVALRIDLIDLLQHSGKSSDARALLDDLEKRAPKNPSVLEFAMRFQLTQKDYASAQHTVELARAALPGAPLADYLGGLLDEAQGRRSEAIAKYAAAVDKNGAADEALNAMAQLLVADKKGDVLTQRLEKLTAAQPKLPQPWQLLGEVYLGAHRAPDAALAFQHAVDLAPGRLQGYHGLSLARLAGNDPEGAIAALTMAQAKLARPDDATFELALLYQKLGRAADAEKLYEVLLARNPYSEPAQNNLAMLLATHTDQASLDRAKVLVAAFPATKNPRLIDTYGWVLTARGEYAPAIATLSAIVEQAPAEPSPRYHLAVAQIKSGQAAAGRANLEKALATTTAFEEAPAAKALLASLPKS